MQQLQAVYPALSYSVRYGLTETPSVAVSHKVFAPPYTENWHSSGKVLPIYTLRIVDEAGVSLPVGQPGEIHIQGECFWRGLIMEKRPLPAFSPLGTLATLMLTPKSCI